MSKPLIALIGDSIRMGYQPFVESLLSLHFEVWGPEENGGNSANLIKLAHQWSQLRQPDLVHFNCGLHDLRTIFYNERENVVPIDHYTANLRTLVRVTREHTNAKLIWAATTPVIDKDAHVAHAQAGDFDRYNADVIRYNKAASSVMKECDVPINDLYSVVEGLGPETIQAGDGVHYTEEGSRVLAEAVAKAIRSHL